MAAFGGRGGVRIVEDEAVAVSIGSASTGLISYFTSLVWSRSCSKVVLPSTPVMCACCEFAESGVGGVHWSIISADISPADLWNNVYVDSPLLLLRQHTALE
jgi:hypothetical protein